MPIVLFIGPDGSGKSSLIEALTKVFQQKNLNVKHVWMRGSHTFISPLAKFLSRFRTFNGSENPYYHITLPESTKRFWQFLEFIGAVPVIIFNFLIPSFMGYWILADRYASDLAIWICLTTNDYGFLKKFEAKILIALTLRTSAKFYVTANIETLNRRTEDVWFPQEQLQLYGKLAETVGAHIIDTTNKSVDESLQEVLRVIDPIIQTAT
ncbi:hypothetical protein D4R86_03200 [bacterium]|nr:MAG: hypothetical protein D4R86_03200 [bacterium]